MRYASSIRRAFICSHQYIYINDEGEWLDDYWFLTFYKTLDCWDSGRSVVDVFEDDEDDDLGGIEPTIEVDKFVLESEVLDEIPKNERLLFKMGGNVSKSYVVVHQKVVDFFENNNISGVRFLNSQSSRKETSLGLRVY